jgi:hypothetical protein
MPRLPPAPRIAARLPALLVLAGSALLSGCGMLGIESADSVAARREAEGKAIGAACRHAGRAIEDCYTLNRRADKAAVFAGWREMNDYMTENKIAEVRPTLPPPGAGRPAAGEGPAVADGSEGDAAAGRAGDKRGGRGS